MGGITGKGNVGRLNFHAVVEQALAGHEIAQPEGKMVFTVGEMLFGNGHVIVRDLFFDQLHVHVAAPEIVHARERDAADED